jgi:hypothetical protein
MQKADLQSSPPQSPIVDFKDSSGKMLHSFFMQIPALLCILKGPEHIYTLVKTVAPFENKLLYC